VVADAARLVRHALFLRPDKAGNYRGEPVALWTQPRRGTCLVAALASSALPGLACENCGPRVLLFVMTVLFSGILLNQRNASQSEPLSPMMPAVRKVLFTVAYGLGSGWIVAVNQLEIKHPLLSVDLPANQLALAAMFTAFGAFMLDGGTIIVRGILDRCGTKPLLAGDDEKNAGRRTRTRTRSRTSDAAAKETRRTLPMRNTTVGG